MSGGITDDESKRLFAEEFCRMSRETNEYGFSSPRGWALVVEGKIEELANQGVLLTAENHVTSPVFTYEPVLPTASKNEPDKLSVNAPRPGVLLYSSCMGEDVMRVLAVGKDANGVPTVDLHVFDMNEHLHCKHDGSSFAWVPKPNGYHRLEEETGFGRHPLTVVEPREVLLRDVQYRIDEKYPDSIELNTPEGGCYRCTQWFTMHDEGDASFAHGAPRGGIPAPPDGTKSHEPARALAAARARDAAWLAALPKCDHVMVDTNGYEVGVCGGVATFIWSGYDGLDHDAHFRCDAHGDGAELLPYAALVRAGR